MSGLPICEASPSPARVLPTRSQIVLAACACAAGSAFVFAINPNQHAVYPQCLLYRTTGIYCAGCGATRAVYALLHGRVLEAVHDNALFVAILPLIGWYGLRHLGQAWKANVWPRIQMENRALLRMSLLVLGLMAGFTLLRNLPGAPFDLLKPLGYFPIK